MARWAVAWLLFAGVCLAAVPVQTSASGAPPPQASPRPSTPDASATFDDVQVSLLTILPGSDIYSLWGHSAIRVVDPSRAVDLSYNYGTFDFETDFFVLKFMHGSLDYLLSVHDFDLARRHYVLEGRPAIEQVLDLTSEQKASLIGFLETNLRPEHRAYRYHFLFDNCSTRVRDALEAALDGAVHFSDEPDPGKTFRELIDPYQRSVPFLDAGIDWLLGAPVDRIATPYQTMFLPDYLMLAFDRARVDAGGDLRPLVARTDTLFWIEGYEPAQWRFPWEAAAAWLLFGAGLVATVRRRGVIRGLDVPLFLVVGLAGVLIAYLWFVSHHDVTEANWHLLWAWPTHLVLGAALLKRRVPTWTARYAIAAGAISLIAVAGSSLWPQAYNPALVPIALLLAVRGTGIAAAWFPRRHRMAHS